MLNRLSAAGLVPAAAFLLSACSGGEQSSQSAAANPCNPCAANPCAAGAPDTDPDLIRQPAGLALNDGGHPRDRLVAMGEGLWNDKSLSGSGTTACSTCHANKYGLMKATFAEPYPHFVQMPKDRAGLDQVNAAEMVQICMVIPMQADPLPWDGVELGALTAYVETIQEGFDASMAAGANPCNPCAANPCNPCAANPCNPCATTP